MRHFFLSVPVMGFTFLALSFSAHAQQDTTITGVGSSFAAPIYQRWAASSQSQTHIKLNYQALGSSAGQNQIMNHTVDFGASDVPLPPNKLEYNHLLQFPTILGGIVPVVNIPNLKSGELHLTGEILANIFLGQITYWDDPTIQNINPHLKMPHLEVAPVHRADGSGTTFIFTSYLARHSKEWVKNAGAGTSITWPSGTGAKGNNGVASVVKNTEGSIGYVEYAYAHENALTTPALKNRTGRFIEPNENSFAKAASSAHWEKAQNYEVDLLDTEGEEAWPILSGTYVLLSKENKNNLPVVQFFSWAFDHGNPTAQSLFYIPLPNTVKNTIRTTVWNHAVSPSSSTP
ncbi:phosphate ABC transporter substrate-binding protein PstS [Entomobacter blattae]|uniref:Phosphate-binding protein PstS n=1 Tax=Entomobacter blattae TaxID=2762277 RepID=A0A7H1NNV8_9PROT|nr:phosphate ABC transporter substrate-binding protein PstS [Entomobacter blattae]QNT77468.1 Phosphate-binding protein PstS [Entomobacter blattae]